MRVFDMMVDQGNLDESGSDSEDDNPDADYSSLTDFVSEMRNSEICGEIRGKQIHFCRSLWV